MDAILKHLLDVTGHRDHEMIEMAILSAIEQIALVKQARILQLGSHQGKAVLQPIAWLEAGQVKTTNPFLDSSEGAEALERYPALQQCIERHDFCLQEKIAISRYKLWIPIWSEDRVSACFEIERSKPFSRNALELLQGMLGVYRNFVNLLDYSETDSLTGLLNRKTFEKHFTKARSVATALTQARPGLPERRHDSSADQEVLEQWLAVVDIDFFKRINDNYGHLYGDEVLILIAQLMKLSFRAHDRIFRFGGEEFVILIHSVSLGDVNHIVERFRKTIENHRFPQVGTITVSVGFTSFHPEQSPVEILGQADRALYYAKEHGRNQSCQYEQLLDAGLLQGPPEMESAPIEYF